MQLISLALMAKSYIESLFEREEGQDVFEYVLIIGGLSVVIVAGVAAFAPGIMGSVIDGVCGAIADPVDGLGFAMGDCTP